MNLERERVQYISSLAQDLLCKYGLDGCGWYFELDRAKARCGCCHYRTKMITLSRFYVTNPVVTMDSIVGTLLHEIAHALAGWEAGHGAKWRDVCIAIGHTNPTRLCDFPTGAPAKWLVKCACNPAGVPRYRASRRLSAKYCPHCGNHLQVVPL
jgi:predicted SprT family Zn-dependent metalloprotease